MKYHGHNLPWPDDDDDIYLDASLLSASDLGGGSILGGTNYAFDAQKGFKLTNADTGGIDFNLSDTNAGLFTGGGCISFEIESDALCFDETLDGGEVFSQGTGPWTSANKPGVIHLLHVYSDADGTANDIALMLTTINNNKAVLKFRTQIAGVDYQWQSWGLSRINMAEFTRLTVSWTGQNVSLYLDNVLFKTVNRPAEFPTLIMNNVTLLSNNAGNNELVGYYVRNLRFMTRPFDMPKNPHLRLACFGDSFTERGGSTNVITDSEHGKPTYSGPDSQNEWQTVIWQYFASRGNNIQIFNHGQSGHAYSNSHQGGTTILIDHVPDLLSDNPSAVLMLSPVNDVTKITTLPSDFQSSLEAIIDQIGAHYSVDRIWITSVPAYDKVSTFTDDATAGVIETANTIIEGMVNYWDTNNPTEAGKVVFIDIFNLEGGHNYNPEWSIGSAANHPVGTSWDTNHHPSPQGAHAIGTILAHEISKSLPV